ncbi:MAG: hypothetical protein NTV29_00340 [Planctomycetota bacterium]|nr:hypothetical protein [Planctomycetota bacterium]
MNESVGRQKENHESLIGVAGTLVINTWLAIRPFDSSLMTSPQRASILAERRVSPAFRDFDSPQFTLECTHFKR